MDLVEQYLNAVAAQLPQAERADIIAELRDLILSRIEGREEALGRSLDAAEVEAILREVGHPLVVAARYRKGPDSLIGPDLFPYWLFAAKAGLIVLAVVQGLSFLIGLKGGPDDFGQGIAQAFHGFFMGGLTLLGALTVAGAVMEQYGIKPRWLTHWRVQDLGAYGMADPAAWAGGADKTAEAAAGVAPAAAPKAKTTGPSGLVAEALFSLIVTAVVLVWWIGGAGGTAVTNWALSGREIAVVAAPIWGVLYAPIALWLTASLVTDAVTVARPYAIRLRAALKIGVNVGALVIGWALAEAGYWFALTRGEETARVEGGLTNLSFETLRGIRDSGSDLIATASMWSSLLSWMLAFALLGCAVSIVLNLWRLATGER